jgi:hypothetical protein
MKFKTFVPGALLLKWSAKRENTAETEGYNIQHKDTKNTKYTKQIYKQYQKSK